MTVEVSQNPIQNTHLAASQARSRVALDAQPLGDDEVVPEARDVQHFALLQHSFHGWGVREALSRDAGSGPNRSSHRQEHADRAATTRQKLHSTGDHSPRERPQCHRPPRDASEMLRTSARLRDPDPKQVAEQRSRHFQGPRSNPCWRSNLSGSLDPRSRVRPPERSTGYAMSSRSLSRLKRHQEGSEQANQCEDCRAIALTPNP